MYSSIVPVLPPNRPLELVARPYAGPALDDPSHQADHNVGRVGPDRVAGPRPVLFEDLTFTVQDPLDLIRDHTDPPVGVD